MKLFLLPVIAFLIGSAPVGLIIAKMRGVDLRKTGSGNIGATNVLRSVGKKEALITLTGDILKGVVPAALGVIFFQDNLRAGLVGLAAVAGHDFSLFQKLSATIRQPLESPSEEKSLERQIGKNI